MASSSDLKMFDPNDLILIGRDTDDGSEHPLYDERVFVDPDDPFVSNLITYGVQLSVLGREIDGRVEVIDGRRRVLGARKANERLTAAGEHTMRVPVRLSVNTDKRASGIMVSANEQRLDDSVLGKALKAVRLYNMTNDMDEVAVAFGRSETTIRNWFSLAQADPLIHEAIKEGKIATQAGVELSRLPREHQLIALKELLLQMTGGRVPQSAAKAKREALEGEVDADTAAANAPSADEGVLGDAQASDGGDGDDDDAETIVQSSPSKKSHQKGITRTMIRKALKSDAANSLDKDQLAVLRWFAFGEAQKSDWFAEFLFDSGVLD